jgi:carbonic anhydrase/acetyltransferase-like protein (isoleucine patch superfamily)
MRRTGQVFSKVFKEGTAEHSLNKFGLTISGTETIHKTFAKHRPVSNLFEKRPLIAQGVFVAPNASVVGHVLIYGDSSIWYGAVLRGDKNRIQIGGFTNIQDRVTLTTVPELESGFSAQLSIGDYCTIGHGSILTSCIVGDYVQIGAGCVVGEGALIEMRSIVAAGSVVLPDTLIAPGQFWAGNPAVYVRDVSSDEIDKMEPHAEEYVNLAAEHMEEFLPYGTTYQEAEKENLIY